MRFFSLALHPLCELSFPFQLNNFPSLSLSEAFFFFGVQWPISSILSVQGSNDLLIKFLKNLIDILYVSFGFKLLEATSNLS